MENKIVAIEISDNETLTTKFNRLLNFREGFTTNKNYIGHTDDNIPVYMNKLLEKGIIKEIMSNQEIKVLPEGKYQAKVEQVIRKHGKDANGNEDTSKDIISIELNVKGEDSFYYLTYCVKGYSDIQTQIANENLNKLMSEFGITIIEELAGKVGTLVAKKNDKGYTNYTLYAPKIYFDWNTIIQFDCEAKFKCIVRKVFGNSFNNKKTFVVEADVNGKKVEEYVSYDLDNKFKAESYEWLKQKLEIGEFDKSFEINRDALLIVKRVSKDGIVYFNKRIGFEKKAPRTPKEW